MRMCHFWAHLSWTKCFWYKPLLLLSFLCLLALFIDTVQNLKKSYSGSRNYEDENFWTQKGPFAPIYFWKINNIILIYLLAPFIVQNSKNIPPAADPDYSQFLGPKWPIFPNEPSMGDLAFYRGTWEPLRNHGFFELFK